MIPSYHCIGSVMFLIESEDQQRSCIYTGDLRAEDFFISSLKYNMHLLPYIKCLTIPSRSTLTLNSIYLDTTFAYRNENISMLSNLQGLHHLSELMDLYPSGTRFIFPDLVSGFEEVWIYLSEKFGRRSLVLNQHIRTRIQVLHKELKDSSQCGTDIYDMQISPFFSLNSLFDLLSCSSEKPDISCRFMIYIGYPDDFIDDIDGGYVIAKSIINITSETFKKLGALKVDSSRTPDEFVVVGNLGCLGHQMIKRVEDSTPFIKNRNANLILPMTLKYFFSRHSSCMETIRFVDQFRTNEVYGIVESEETWNKGFNMKRYYGHLCRANSFKFDTERTQMYGPKKFEEDSVELLDNLNFNGTDDKQTISIAGEMTNESPKSTAAFDEFGNNLVFKGMNWNKRPECISKGTNKNRRQYLYNKLFITRNFDGTLTSPFSRVADVQNDDSISVPGSGDSFRSQEEMMCLVQRNVMERKVSRKISFQAKVSHDGYNCDFAYNSECAISYDFSFQAKTTELTSTDREFKDSLLDNYPVCIDMKFRKYKSINFRKGRTLAPKKKIGRT